MPGSATYPSWHPGGRYVAFSSNQVRQSFYGNPSKVIEVFDLISSIIIFDNEKNEIRMVRDQDTTKYLSTFPSWSPDGKYLYYCRAIENGIGANPELDEIRSMRYDIVRTAFDAETGLTGNTEMVFRASSMGKSASFPRISPDGKYLVLTLDDYGTFPIWHREADLYLLDLQSRNCTKMDLNSDENESYHTWSSNSRWLVFSSKRMDGRSGRSFIAWIDTNGHAGKPFVVPQKDPRRYGSMLESFNIPEFVTGRISVGPRDFIAASKQQSVKSVPADKADSIMRPDLKKLNVKPNPGETPLHE
jgi:Tol biopolymer transport system component